MVVPSPDETRVRAGEVPAVISGARRAVDGLDPALLQPVAAQIDVSSSETRPRVPPTVMMLFWMSACSSALIELSKRPGAELKDTDGGGLRLC